MTVNELYDKFLIKSERNSTSDGVSVDKGRFVSLYNEHQNRFVEYIYEKKNEDDIRYIQSLLVNQNIRRFDTQNNVSFFLLPSNYLDLSNVSGRASKGNCSGQKIYLFEIKDFNQNIVLSDEFTKPSFEYRECPYIISDNKVKVFTSSDFKLDSINLSYYRYPNQISLLDSDDPESGFKDNVIDFDDKVIDRIITLSIGGFDINSNNNERWQLDQLSSKNKV